MRHRVQVADFMQTTSSLVKALVGYEQFLYHCEDEATTFQNRVIVPAIASISGLGHLFQYDMDHVLFDGLEAAMHEIMTIYGPSRDTIYFFIERVVLNSKEVSLHLKHLLLTNHLAENMVELVHTTRFYAEEVIMALPSYYQMVSNTSYTLQGIHWEIHNFSFFPRNLAKITEECNAELEHFVNMTWIVDFFLEEILHDMELYAQGHRELNLERILRDLYKKIHEYEEHYKFFKDECLEQFITAVDDLHKFNDTYHEDLSVHTHLEYTFDFEEDSKLVRKDYQFLKEMTVEYLLHANTTKYVIQYNLTELVISDMMSRALELVTNIKFRLMERFRLHLDVVRLDFTHWYAWIQEKAIEFDQYVSEYYMEHRAREMYIWRSPMAITPNDHDHEKFHGDPVYFADATITEHWTDHEYLHEVSINATHDILENFVKPINGVLNSQEHLLSHYERELETSLKGLMAWMSRLRSDDENSEKFVL